MRHAVSLLLALFFLVPSYAGDKAATQRFVVVVPPSVEVVASARSLRIRSSVPIAIHDTAQRTDTTPVIHAVSDGVITISNTVANEAHSQPRTVTILPL